MSKESYRPSNTIKWEISMPIIIPVSEEDTRDYAIVKQNRTTITRTNLARHKATVIVGRKEDHEILITPVDIVFTCIFGSSGHLSTLPEEFIGREVTIIYKQ